MNGDPPRVPCPRATAPRSGRRYATPATRTPRADRRGSRLRTGSRQPTQTRLARRAGPRTTPPRTGGRTRRLSPRCLAAPRAPAIPCSGPRWKNGSPRNPEAARARSNPCVSGRLCCAHLQRPHKRGTTGADAQNTSASAITLKMRRRAVTISINENTLCCRAQPDPRFLPGIRRHRHRSG